MCTFPNGISVNFVVFVLKFIMVVKTDPKYFIQKNMTQGRRNFKY